MDERCGTKFRIRPNRASPNRTGAPARVIECTWTRTLQQTTVSCRRGGGGPFSLRLTSYSLEHRIDNVAPRMASWSAVELL